MKSNKFWWYWQEHYDFILGNTSICPQVFWHILYYCNAIFMDGKRIVISKIILGYTKFKNTHIYIYQYNDSMISYSMFISIHKENYNFAKLLDSPLSVWILLYTCHYFGNAKKKELHPLCTYAMLKNVNTLYIIRRNLSPFNVSWGSQLCMVREAHRVNSRDSWSSSYLPPHCL